MSAIGSIGSGAGAQLLAAQKAQSQSQAGAAKSAEEQAESPAQEAAEHEGNGLNVLA